MYTPILEKNVKNMADCLPIRKSQFQDFTTVVMKTYSSSVKLWMRYHFEKVLWKAPVCQIFQLFFHVADVAGISRAYLGHLPFLQKI